MSTNVMLRDLTSHLRRIPTVDSCQFALDAVRTGEAVLGEVRKVFGFREGGCCDGVAELTGEFAVWSQNLPVVRRLVLVGAQFHGRRVALVPQSIGTCG